MSEAELNPVDAADEEFVVGGDASEMKSKYDFEGNYKVEVTGLKPQKSSKGSDMIVATLVGQEGPATGLVFTDYLVRFKLKNLLEASDTPFRTTDEDKLAFKQSQLQGKVIVAKFKREEYNGKWSAKVGAYINPNHSVAAGHSTDDVPF